jgi:hypothetical protein
MADGLSKIKKRFKMKNFHPRFLAFGFVFLLALAPVQAQTSHSAKSNIFSLDLRGHLQPTPTPTPTPGPSPVPAPTPVPPPVPVEGNILANQIGYRAAINFRESSADRLVTIREPSGEPGVPPYVYREVMEGPVVLNAAINAFLGNKDWTNWPNAATEVSIEIGDFQLLVELGAADLFNPQGRAVFRFGEEEQIDLPNGNVRTIYRNYGTVTLLWSPRTQQMRAQIRLNNLQAAGFDPVLMGQYKTVSSETGGTVGLSGLAIPVRMAVGDAVGERILYAAGTSTRTVRMTGAGDNREEHVLYRAAFRGIADILPPRIVAQRVPQEMGASWEWSGTVLDVSQVGSGAQPVRLAAVWNGVAVPGDRISLGASDAFGRSPWQITGLVTDADRPRGMQELQITATDTSGNNATLRRVFRLR